MEAEETTRLDDLASAWDASEEDTNAEAIQTDEVSEPEVEPDSGAEFSGRGRSDEEPDGVHEGAVRQSGEHADGADSGGQENEGASLETPPRSMSPAAREQWKDTPDAVRQEFARIDQRMEGMAQKYGRDAQRAQQMDRALAPFSQLFAMNGGPGETLPGLLQTASVLQMGAPQQKAEMVANIIKQFGVDINTLDNLLVGEAPPPEVQQQTQVQQAVQQAVAPYQQTLSQLQAQQQYAAQQSQQEVASEVDAFARQPENEFYHDVKADMADILDMAANRGIEMDLKTAYDRACLMNPEISKIIQTRQGAQSTQQKRRASSSIHGTPGGEGDVAAPNSIAAALNDAWDNAGRV